MSDETEPNIEFELSVLGEARGEIHTVPIGLSGLPSVVMRMVPNADETGAIVRVSTGAPFGNDVEGLNDIANFFEMAVEVLRDPGFQAKWQKQMEAQLALEAVVSETGADVIEFEDDDEDVEED